MIELSVGQLIDKYKIPAEKSAIYVVRDGQSTLYIGKSEGISGVIGRLDNHLGLERRAGGNYLKFYMKRSDFSKVYDQLKEFLKSHSLRDNETIACMMCSGLAKVLDVRQQYPIRWCTKSPIGIYILDRLPESMNWRIELYSVDECRELIGAPVDIIDVSTAERSLIRQLRPKLNVIYS